LVFHSNFPFQKVRCFEGKTACQLRQIKP
jgi:hypothetical protein